MCGGGTLRSPCNARNTLSSAEEEAFGRCSACARDTWQRRADLGPIEAVGVDAWICLSFARVKFNQKVYVAATDEAYSWLQKTMAENVVLTWQEFCAVVEGCSEADVHDKRLLEALNYFASVQGSAGLSHY